MLPKSTQKRPEWQAAAEARLLVVERGGAPVTNIRNVSQPKEPRAAGTLTKKEQLEARHGWE
ncbi:hypothetical protein AYJ54_45500 [Bradyrhizobium centrolobii]|uniref:Uncharacterized protein n=1 Tax=Bradyrhizobium centrolobii TaxID=1505087 RepID=A0A176Z0G1_9BRAD|nr:hypothetical protein [Bradyrhizobium centrolobii]OAF12998.1 hypothetical protein AYJ54_45500 [Bradyrhizobium centrolobii]